MKTEVSVTSGIRLTEKGRGVLERKYLKRNKRGDVIETPGEIFHRVTRTIATADLIYDSKSRCRGKGKRIILVNGKS